MRLVGVQNVRSRLCVLLIALPMMSTNSCNSDRMLRPKAQLPRDSESILRARKLSLSIGNTLCVSQMLQRLEYIL